MSGLPERIWIWKDGVGLHVLRNKYMDTAQEYLRADLAPTVGFSRDQMMDAIFDTFAHGIDTPEKAEDYLKDVTPAAPDPKVLVEALERIAKEFDTTYPQKQWALDAIAEYRKGGRG